MGAVLVALLLAQAPDLFDGETEPPPPAPAPAPVPRPDGPLVIPPPDGPVPPGVPVPDETAPHVEVRRKHDQTRELLIAERLELQRTMPSYAIPTVVTVAGGVALAVGGGLAGLSAPSVFGAGRGDRAVFYFGLPLGLVGLGAFVFGLIWVRERSLDREAFLQRIDEIEQELGW